MAEISKNAAKSAQSQIELWQENHYYKDAEKYIEGQWNDLVWPIIKNLDFSHVVDLACGHGRNSTALAPISNRLTLVDIAPNNINVCQERFKGNPKVNCILGNGVEIPLPDNSVSLVYCFDAMVHFAPEVVFEYLHEAFRILKPGGGVFFHHSNFCSNHNLNFSYNPHARNHMSQNLFLLWAKTAGFHIVSSQVIDWGEGGYKIEDLDCLSLLRKKLCQG